MIIENKEKSIRFGVNDSQMFDKWLADHDKQIIADERERIVEELEKEYKLAEEEKRRSASENQLQFDSAKGYSTGIWNALEIVRSEVNE